MPYTRPYPGGFQDFPATTTPIDASALNTIDVGVKTANDQFQTVTTAQRATLTPSVGQAVWDSDLKQLMVFMNASGGNAWQPVGNRIVCASTTRPSSPFEGQEIYETDSQKTLVYDGANWIETSDLDSTNGLPSSAQAKLDAIGLTYISKKVFTSGTNTTMDGVFTSSYTHYRLLARGTSDQASITDLLIDLRAAGVDLAGSAYYRIGTYNNNTSGPLRVYSAATNGWLVGFHGNFAEWSMEATIYAPQLTTAKQIISSGTGWGNTSSASGVFQGLLNSTTACDGFKLRAASGNIAGTIWVYGYNAG